MGRPRKRQFIDVAAEESVIAQNTNLPDAGNLPSITDDFNIYNEGNIAEPYYTNKSGFGQTPIVSKDGRSSTIENGRVVWHFGDRQVVAGPPINYGNIDFGNLDHDIPSLSDGQTLSATTSNLSSGSENSSPKASASGPSGPCSCLASMYLALASLQTFPTDVVEALKTIRGAAATAAMSIWCPQCGSVVLENPEPPIEAFQNTMLLGTILPIIANGYQRLLKMIDDETDIAVAAGSTKTFRFHEYGGMCGKQEDIEASITCIEKEMFFNAVEMPPHQWRNTVRALLRVDIYGHDQSGFKHKGLKDLVAEMELRQIARHELLDEWAMTGKTFGTMENGSLCNGEHTQSQPQPRACMQILQMAKVAIDNLVIA
jgi:hypothetical protein